MNNNKNKPAPEFYPETVNLNGMLFPAEYSVTPSRAVIAFVTIEDGEEKRRMKIRLEPGDEHYPAALQAASEPVPAAPAEPVEPAPAALVPDSISDPAPAADPKQRRGEVPEKFFIGMEIKGRGWVIEFSAAYDRTRVIFKKCPAEAAREACKRHGFYWSPTMKSWNKKLSHKAWRAAQALAMELKTICG